MPAPHFRPAAAAALAVALGLAALAGVPALADGPKDNAAENVRPVPPKGVAVDPAVVKELNAGLADLAKAIADATAAAGGNPKLLDLLPDVEIYHKAVRYAVEYGEFFAPKEPDAAKKLLATGLQRAKELNDGKPSWPTATGPVVRGYRSKIDGSVQPYGLIVPKAFGDAPATKRRLDFWWHGRGENLSEVNFITQRQGGGGDFAPADSFVLHPYGRYCNANKFAGEVDTFECLEHARKHYPVDDARLTARGFSMGGAACWQFATHYPTLWAAANPGAGFAETPEFLNVFQNEKVSPTWYEKKLWHLYNATDFAQNIFNLPTVAYSGEVDKQKQAADVMAREMKKVGLELNHVIGPKTAHSYEKNAKVEVAKRVDALVAKGRDPWPKEIKFVTYTLRYNTCAWVTVEGLARHWERASVAGEWKDDSPALKTENVTALSLSRPGKDGVSPSKVVIDGATLELPPNAGAADAVLLGKHAGKWVVTSALSSDAHAKRHGLQGPIDDAFMDSFIMVSSTGTPLNEKVGAWATAEMKHAVEHWRKQFRGDARVVADKDVTAKEIAESNLVLWGDPQSNTVLAKIADKLPVKWTKDGVVVGGETYPAGTHVPVLIYPNPLNPRKYVVLNSGFTFREYDYLNNARQVPKLPDYAVIDVTTPPNARHPGKVVRAGFFGEKWELLADDGM